jgi:hypothetical protein
VDVAYRAPIRAMQFQDDQHGWVAGIRPRSCAPRMAGSRGSLPPHRWRPVSTRTSGTCSLLMVHRVDRGRRGHDSRHHGRRHLEAAGHRARTASAREAQQIPHAGARS